MDTNTGLTGHERSFDPNELIVSKTDLKGRITYANSVFLRVAGYEEHEVLGKAHNIIRHPDMPRCVFKLLWERLEEEREVFAFVVNRCKNGDHYWVFAHVTPSYNAGGRHVGYHSNRRVPRAEALEPITALYADLRRVERQHQTPGAQWGASLPVLHERIAAMGTTYDELVFSLATEYTESEAVGGAA